MKPFNHPTPTSSRTSARPHTEPDASDKYVSLRETQALLAGSLAMRQQRLEAGDMVSTDEAAQMTGTTRVTMNAWIAQGRAIGLTRVKRGFRLPRWQFDAPIWETLPKLSEALGTNEGWALLNFLETPHHALDNATPRQTIERGNSDRVVTVAAGESK